MVERVVGNSFSLALMVGTILTIAAILSSDFLLRLMDTPPENFAMASSYLKITLAGFILFYLGFLINSILRGIGDAVTPLVFMSIGIGINAVLDPFFIGGWGLFASHGLNGAAYATLISQVIAVGISIFYLNRKGHFVAFNPRKLILDKHITYLLFKIGFPSIIQQSLISISGMFVQTFVNSFGASAANAFGAVLTIDMFAFMPAMSMSMAVATLTGQNLGAGRPERVKRVFKSGVMMTSSITVLISFIVVVFSKFILIMFGLGDDAKVMEIGISYLRIAGSCYIFFAIMFISNGVINGAGHTIITMVFTLLSLWLIRVPLAWFLSKTNLGIAGIWIAIACSFFVTMIVSLTYYFSGRWKKSAVIKTPTPM
jgi:putative MATE family efflux protein